MFPYLIWAWGPSRGPNILVLPGPFVKHISPRVIFFPIFFPDFHFFSFFFLFFLRKTSPVSAIRSNGDGPHGDLHSCRFHGCGCIIFFQRWRWRRNVNRPIFVIRHDDHRGLPDRPVKVLQNWLFTNVNGGRIHTSAYGAAGPCWVRSAFHFQW